MLLLYIPLVLLVLSLLWAMYRYYLEVIIFFFNGCFWDINLILDKITFSILLMLILCFGYAFFYTSHYFRGASEGNQLNLLIMFFVGVMSRLVLTGDLISTLIFWEYLGVVSYFLILFYLNYLSLRSSVVTLVSSRFGDVCLFFFIGITRYYTSWIWALSGLIFYFIVFTKRAGFPFIRWLLEAMRAPTPVSSLVHSSTLVAAGVWFCLRYNPVGFIGDYTVILRFLLITIFITGVCCFFFVDLKKIIALSTCNNIAWCLFYLIMGDRILSLFQLVSHGVSKCILFMLVGDVMRGSGGSQASNCVYSPSLYGNWGIFRLFSIILGLSGAPFIGIFFTKHLLLTWFRSSLNIIILIVTLLCMFLSYFYSFRLCRVLINKNRRITRGVLFVYNSGLIGIMWLFINYFIGGGLDETRRVTPILSLSLIFFQVFSVVAAYLWYNRVAARFWARRLFGCDNLVELFYNLFSTLRVYISIFFYRWDKHVLVASHQKNYSYLFWYQKRLLNLVFFRILCFLFIWIAIV